MSDTEDEMIIDMNEQLVLIVGESGTGKSASLRNLRNQEKWVYENCEAGKRLPFRNKFISQNITNPYDIYGHFDEATANIEAIDGIIIDTVTFLMDTFESAFVINSANTMKAWGDYQQYFKNLMQQYVPRFPKPVLMLAHTRSELDEKAMEMKTKVPVKGALQNNGIEAFFSTIVATKKVSIKDLEKYESDLLTIDDRDRDLGFKHVFQTQVTKTTIGERIRAPMGLFTVNQTYMDNDAQLLLDHLHKYYN